MAMHPNSLANLQPWGPGVSGNPAGRKPAGLSMQEWINELVGRTEEAIQQIADDGSAPAVKRIAAKALLGALKDGWFKGKREGADDFDRIMDRTIGKPVQSVMVHHAQPDDPVALREQFRQMLTNDPELCKVIGDLAHVDALPAVDTTAETIEASTDP